MNNNYKQVQEIINTELERNNITGLCIHTDSGLDESINLWLEGMDRLYLLDQEEDPTETVGDIIQSSADNLKKIIRSLSRVKTKLVNEIKKGKVDFSQCPQCNDYDYEHKIDKVVKCEECGWTYNHKDYRNHLSSKESSNQLTLKDFPSI